MSKNSKKSSTKDPEYKSIDVGLVRRLLTFLKPYRRHVLLALILTIFASFLGPIRPYLTKIAIDDYIVKGNSNGLIEIILIIFGMLLFQGLAQFAMSLLMQWVGQNVLHDIRIKVFNHIQRLSLKFFDKNSVGKLVTRATSDVQVLNEMFSTGVVMVIADVLLILWIVAFMFFTSVNLALLTLTVLPILVGISIVFRFIVRDIFRDIRVKVGEINSFLNEFINGISTIKLFAQEENLSNKFDKTNDEHKVLWVRTVFYYSLFFPAVEILSALALGLVLWYTAGNILDGYMTIGILVAFLQYAEMFFRPIRDLTEKYTTLQSAMASGERVFNILDEKEIVRQNNNLILESFNDSIVFDNVSFSYDDKKQVLKNLNFKVNKGETIAIVGATGSGKSSIINLLLRFYEYQTGNIFVDNKDIRDLNIESLREKIALVLQDVFLFSATISQNISLDNDKISKEMIIESAKALGAIDFINNLDGGIDNLLNERGQKLSSGQKQLISFCRAFAYNPEILILDEATSNIDSQTEQIIEKSLNILLDGRTSIIIAHRLSTIKRADRIIVLHHGKIAEEGTHTELINNNGIYSKLYKLQQIEEIEIKK